MVLGVLILANKYKSSGRDRNLLEVIRHCGKVIEQCSNVLNYGIDNYSLVRGLVNQIADTGESLERIISELPRPPIAYMAKEVESWYNSSPEELKAEFITTPFENLVVFNSTLGMDIRNKFNLWMFDWDKQLVDGVDVSPNHPDSLSMDVIKTVWRKVKND